MSVLFLPMNGLKIRSKYELPILLLSIRQIVMVFLLKVQKQSFRCFILLITNYFMCKLAIPKIKLIDDPAIRFRC